MWWRWSRVGLVGMVGFVGILGLAKTGWLIPSVFSNKPNSVPAATLAQPVSTALPIRKMLQAAVTVAGVWIAREEVAISSPLDGLRVTEVLAESGDWVKQGQVLVRLEREALDSQIRQVEQRVQRARVEEEQVMAQYERMRRLKLTGAISRQEYENQQAIMLAAQTVLRQAQSEWDEQRLRQAHSEIRAPVAGTISQRLVQIGSMVSSQSTLFKLINGAQLEFLVQIPQQILPELSIGLPVQVETRGQNGMMAGTIRLIGTEVDSTTGYGEARVTLEAAPQVMARPGSVGSAWIVLAQRNVLAVDIRALRYDSGNGQDQSRAEPYVFVVDTGYARRTPVRVGLRDGGWVEILNGLETSSEVVVMGASFLQDGDNVLPKRLETSPRSSDLNNRSQTQKLQQTPHLIAALNSGLRK
ncbi:efflux RND transporter periplasmic adaptor subunit [Yersinia wautersii]|uniref:efflux RND transporter periplasmic adaptor subunit n=1 Tax=Yersinia pseudotuberculosis TaxID=633 RepID=UPI0015E77577|nr:efflux RND transporter periplasmic adaptor subunit [Yersinia pseudotuberculosis]